MNNLNEIIINCTTDFYYDDNVLTDNDFNLKTNNIITVINFLKKHSNTIGFISLYNFHGFSDITLRFYGNNISKKILYRSSVSIEEAIILLKKLQKLVNEL